MPTQKSNFKNYKIVQYVFWAGDQKQCLLHHIQSTVVLKKTISITTKIYYWLMSFCFAQQIFAGSVSAF